MNANSTNGYAVRSELNPNMVLCTDGKFHCKAMVGAGGYSARVYVIAAQARKYNPGRLVSPVVDGAIQYETTV